MTEVMVVALRRRPDLSRDAFLTHWRDTHAPLVSGLAAALGIARYVQLRPDGAAEAAWDGLALVTFQSRADLDRRLAAPAGRSAARALRDDELKFMDAATSTRWWGSEHRIL